MIIEATDGNTGLGLALVTLAKGYRIILAVPVKMSFKKIPLLKTIGADVPIFDPGQSFHPFLTLGIVINFSKLLTCITAYAIKTACNIPHMLYISVF
jgi:hypothetical protein